jgi:F-type H+-transporting ATPase subunit alpha
MDTIESTKDLSADNEKLLVAAIESFKASAAY